MLAMSKAKKSPKADRHTQKRRNIALPEPWADLADRLAAMGKPQPTGWFVMECIREKALAAGIKELPLAPWEKPTTDTAGQS